MTDKEIKSVAMSAATEYFRGLPAGVPFNMEACLDAELTAFKRAYNQRHGLLEMFTRDIIRKITVEFVRLRPELEAMTQEHIRKLMKCDKVSEINGETARAVMESLLEGSGLDCSLYCQKYRLKMTVNLPRRSSVVLFFQYSDFHKKDLSALRDALKTLEAAVEPVRKGGMK